MTDKTSENTDEHRDENRREKQNEKRARKYVDAFLKYGPAGPPTQNKGGKERMKDLTRSHGHQASD